MDHGCFVCLFASRSVAASSQRLSRMPRAPHEASRPWASSLRMSRHRICGLIYGWAAPASTVFASLLLQNPINRTARLLVGPPGLELLPEGPPPMLDTNPRQSSATAASTCAKHSALLALISVQCPRLAEEKLFRSPSALNLGLQKALQLHQRLCLRRRISPPRRRSLQPLVKGNPDLAPPQHCSYSCSRLLAFHVYAWPVHIGRPPPKSPEKSLTLITMSLNWNAFLSEDLNLPNEQWSDAPRTTAGRSSDMPTSSATRTAGPEASDSNNFESALSGTTTDPYFNDNFFTSNDYFLSDLEVLQPFGDTIGSGGESTSESSPEPTTGIALTGHTVFQHETSSSSATPASTSTGSGSNQSPPMQSTHRQPQRAQTFPNPTYESMFPNSLDTGFVEDLTFPNGPTGPASSSKASIDNAPKASAGSTTIKRTKAGKPDILSACWTSPLCPNHDQDGPPPNPANCGGGCAPFLFASEDTLPTPTVDSNLLSQAQEVTAEEGIVEIQPRPRKRTESDASSSVEPLGRQFPNNKNTTEIRPRMKSEASGDSPEQTPPQEADDSKPKSRRRLPHNQVERKYRESLNTQLDSLRRVVPALQQSQRACDGADIEDLPTPSKPSKAVVLASATAYIKQMEKDKKSLAEENQLLRTRIKALQALVKCEDCSLMQYVMDLKINQAQVQKYWAFTALLVDAFLLSLIPLLYLGLTTHFHGVSRMGVAGWLAWIADYSSFALLEALTFWAGNVELLSAFDGAVGVAFAFAWPSPSHDTLRFLLSLLPYDAMHEGVAMDIAILVADGWGLLR
ncbi:uncharacterized protein BDR25DRAFT_354940 [Lindgomyces ingoldianus]|uniref:Uncharacterized protein n=1 Tax=Lindgomyces ingoldianus TaxID=673940 RepID=A0ACB6QVJ7_9PLEO|nr:uncharacterized protein BDR25DRAFT_354940 [Lindgomyces ingoldianus]KAF2471028.1 hypothetical protein BDR25DRAFT_354940 [Lindgomyces ingoldianus]